MNIRMLSVNAAVLASTAVAWSCFAADPNALSDFQDLTFQGWEGHTEYMSIKPNGGPSGAGDAYLRVTADGGTSAGSRLAIDTADHLFTGDYRAAGITAIEADFLNLGTQPHEMRAVLFSGLGNRMTSTTSALIPADGEWHHAVFPLDQASMTIVMGAMDYDMLFGNVTSLMFRHNSGAPGVGGTPIATVGGFDNIHLIPSPGVLGVRGLAGVSMLRRRR